MASPPIAPTYLPSGYKRAGSLTGVQAFGFGQVGRPGFANHPEQAVIWYSSGTGATDVAHFNPLLIFSAPSDAAELSATENHPGVALDLGIPGLSAQYHDGWWRLGRGADERELGRSSGRYISWDSSHMHSITMAAPLGKLAVRGSRDFGIAQQELVRVARSLFVQP